MNLEFLTMNNFFLGIYTILKWSKWLLIACVLPIWYIGALVNNSLKEEDILVIGILSIYWMGALAITIFGQ